MAFEFEKILRQGRKAKKLSQEQLAIQIDGLTANDISKAERGEKELSQAQLRAIAKVTGVTQKSLLEAPKGGFSGNMGTTAKQTSKTSGAARKTSGTGNKTSSSATKKTSNSTGKTSNTSSVTAELDKLSASEKKMLELYRAAKSDNKKLATKILKGESLELGDLLPLMNSEDGLLGSFLGKVQSLMK